MTGKVGFVWSSFEFLHQFLKMFHLPWYTWLVDFLLEEAIIWAAFELKPAALANSTPASKHEDSSSGDFDETDGNVVVSEGLVSLEGGDGFPGTASSDLETTPFEARMVQSKLVDNL